MNSRPLAFTVAQSLWGAALTTSFQVIFRIYQQLQFSREIVLPALLLFEMRVWMMFSQIDALHTILHKEHL